MPKPRSLQRIFAAILLGLLAGSAPGRSMEEEMMRQDWFELSSGSVRVYSCAPTQSVFEVVAHLEHFGAAYGDLAGVPATSSRPIEVMVYPDKKSMWTFGDRDDRTGRTVTNYGGRFYGDNEDNLIVMALGQKPAELMEMACHEYTHWLLRDRIPDWPPWLNEGMAEFYATMEMDDQSARLGKPRSGQLRRLSRTPLLPWPQVLALKQDSMEQLSPDKISLFYAQSWLLTHYLKLGDDAYYRDRFPTLTTLLGKGQEPGQAFTNTFGARLSLLEEQLRLYLAHGRFNISTNRFKQAHSALPLPSTRPLSAAEVCYRLGNQLLRARRLNDAESWFGKSRELAPKGAWSSVGLGMLAARRGKSAEAVRFLEEAIQRGGGDYLVHFKCGKERYALAAGSNREYYPRLPKNVAAKIRANFQRSIVLMPSFGPAHSWLGHLETAQGEDLAAAERQFRLAAQLDPQDQSNLLPLADVQIRRRRPQAARETLKPLLQPDVQPSLRQDAEDLWRRIAP